MAPLLLVASCCFLLLLAVPSILCAQQEPIIDVHVHTFAPPAGPSSSKMPNPVTGQAVTAVGVAAHEKAVFEAMQRLGIVKAVVSGGYNDVLQWKKDAPDRVIVGIACCDPAKFVCLSGSGFAMRMTPVE